MAKFGVVCSIFMIWVILPDSREGDDVTKHDDKPIASFDMWLDVKQTKEFTGIFFSDDI